MATVLSAEQLSTALAGLPGWAGDTNEISRTITASGFLGGISLVTAVADAAETMNHHPDIDIRWRDVTFRLSTHSDGGVTELDLALAARINELASIATGA
ncbi:MAG TPA: 4a-hydroxytetrahydrobiopterin dehydratase [Rugosimonospora sp.]|jgi:4a-hydroxytetrahydrobiopterin dehydratase